jgi:hypothetical protein
MNVMNWLHRYFEDLQGHSGHMSPYWQQADTATRWHIRQLTCCVMNTKVLCSACAKSCKHLNGVDPVS